MGGTVAMAGMAAVVFVGLVWRRMWGRAGLVGVATAGAGVLVVGVKHVVGRSRPPVVDHLVVETNQSFPSGHSLGSIVVIGVLAALLVLWAGRTAVRVAVVAVAAIFVAAVGISRLYLGVHWPTDILGGWSLGGLWLVLCLVAWRPVQGVVAARLARRK
ncbi:phosphatase PAP2 family protein [Nocardia terpenica]|uniref:phosphatase PAP2 family protein n=2 Tax=Nocardia terpenica TaxID=455432 RepID=UPI00155849A0|nr:phosphatase PAP2 family protein [Nocardia terpenica]NQE90371.1 phosphatase PAP2 family protein [Nocardia terpenica]